MTIYSYTVVCDCTGSREIVGTIADRRGDPLAIDGFTVSPRFFQPETTGRGPKDIVNNTIRCRDCRKTAQLSTETVAAVCDGLKDSTVLPELPPPAQSFQPEVRRELPLAVLCLYLSRITR